MSKQSILTKMPCKHLLATEFCMYFRFFLLFEIKYLHSIDKNTIYGPNMLVNFLIGGDRGPTSNNNFLLHTNFIVSADWYFKMGKFFFNT